MADERYPLVFSASSNAMGGGFMRAILSHNPLHAGVGMQR
jgi:hypothetical protein